MANHDRGRGRKGNDDTVEPGKKSPAEGRKDLDFEDEDEGGRSAGDNEPIERSTSPDDEPEDRE